MVPTSHTTRRPRNSNAFNYTVPRLQQPMSHCCGLLFLCRRKFLQNPRPNSEYVAIVSDLCRVKGLAFGLYECHFDRGTDRFRSPEWWSKSLDLHFNSWSHKWKLVASLPSLVAKVTCRGAVSSIMHFVTWTNQDITSEYNWSSINVIIYIYIYIYTAVTIVFPSFHRNFWRVLGLQNAEIYVDCP